MRRLGAWLSLSVAVLVLALVLTAGTGLGIPLRDYNLSFLLLAVATAAAWPALRRRRVASLALAYAGVLAIASGFLLLYLKDGLKSGGLKDWMKWWHSVTSFAFLLLFLVHWWHNNPRLATFTRRLLGRDAALGYPVLGTWAIAAAIGAWTWGAAGRDLFTEENYLYISSWAILVAVAFTYGLWWLFRAPRLRDSLDVPRVRNRARSLVDTSMWIANWAALLTGFALLYFKDFLHGNGFKYVSKWWHTSTSAALVALLVLHVGFNARLLLAHAARLDAEAARGGRDAGEAPDERAP